MQTNDTGETMLELPDLPSPAQYVAWYAAHTPGAQAAWHDGRYLSYAELEHRVDRLGRAFAALGLGRGDRVGVLSTSSVHFYAAWLATLRAGLVYVGLNPRYTHRELAYVVRDAQPAAVLSIAEFEGRDYAAETAQLADEFPCIRHTYRVDPGPPHGGLAPLEALLMQASGIDEEAWRARCAGVGRRDPAVIVYTSGSTGAPKGAVIPHESIVYGPRVAAQVAGLSQPRTLCALPINHIGCLADLCTSVLAAGGMIAFLDRFDAAQMLECVETLRLTSLQHTPTVLQMLTQRPEFATRDLSSLRFVGWGGAALSIDTLRAYRRLGVRMLLGYGQTECISNICYADHTYSDEDLTTTIGRPDPNQQVKLVDEQLNEVPDGEPGEILARHPAQMLGYHNRPDATAAAFTPDGFLRTGDVAVRRPDGVLRIVGRRSDMFKSGGYNVYPREIELCLEDHPAIAVAAVIGVPDAVYSEVGYAYLLARSGQPHPGEDELRAWCRERLANYKVPKSFFVRDELPLLPIGKVDKQALKREVTASLPTTGAKQVNLSVHSRQTVH